MHLLAHGCSCFEGHAGTSEAGKLRRQKLHTYGVKSFLIQGPRFSQGFVICLKMIFGHGSLVGPKNVYPRTFVVIFISL